MVFNEVEESFGVNFWRCRAVIGGEVDERLQPPRKLLPEAVLGEQVDDAEVVPEHVHNLGQFS